MIHCPLVFFLQKTAQRIKISEIFVNGINSADHIIFSARIIRKIGGIDVCIEIPHHCSTIAPVDWKKQNLKKKKNPHWQLVEILTEYSESERGPTKSSIPSYTKYVVKTIPQNSHSLPCLPTQVPPYITPSS